MGGKEKMKIKITKSNAKKRKKEKGGEVFQKQNKKKTFKKLWKLNEI